MHLRLKHALRRFSASEGGGMSVEAVIIFPILLWAFIAMFVFFDAFKSQNINLKATYTIADMISREGGNIDAGFIDGANDAYGFLTGNRPENETRVTMINVQPGPDGVTPEMVLQCSYSTDGTALPRIDDIALIENRVPLMSIGDWLIIVDTEVFWEPVMERVPLVGTILAPRTLSETVFTSPRFSPQIFIEPTATHCNFP